MSQTRGASRAARRAQAARDGDVRASRVHARGCSRDSRAAKLPSCAFGTISLRSSPPQDLTYSVRHSRHRGEIARLLDNVNGYLLPGEMVRALQFAHAVF